MNLSSDDMLPSEVVVYIDGVLRVASGGVVVKELADCDRFDRGELTALEFMEGRFSSGSAKPFADWKPEWVQLTAAVWSKHIRQVVNDRIAGRRGNLQVLKIEFNAGGEEVAGA